jgi:hypothetical protein
MWDHRQVPTEYQEMESSRLYKEGDSYRDYCEADKQEDQ